jgi:hypothetical protein
MVGVEVHMPLLVCGRLPMLVESRLLLVLLQLVDIGLLLVGLPLPPLLVVVVVMLRLVVGG